MRDVRLRVAIVRPVDSGRGGVGSSDFLWIHFFIIPTIPPLPLPTRGFVYSLRYRLVSYTYYLPVPLGLNCLGLLCFVPLFFVQIFFFTFDFSTRICLDSRFGFGLGRQLLQ